MNSVGRQGLDPTGLDCSPVLFVGTNVVGAGLPLEGFDGRRVWLVRKIKRASEM